MLPEATQYIREESKKTAFLESLRVSPEDQAENIQQTENIQIRQDEKDEPSLDD